MRALSEFADSQAPVAIKGACREWHLTRSLSGQRHDQEKISYFHRLLKGQKLQFTYLPPQLEGDLGFGADGRPNVPYLTHESSASDFIDGVRRCVLDPTYGVTYAQSRPLSAFPKVAAGVGLERHIGGLPRASARLWVGSGGHVNALHFDCYANFIFLVAGQKRVCLFPPDSFAELEPTPPRRGIGGATSSRVKLLMLSPSERMRLRPLFKRGVYVVLRPGDGLFIPPNWWHHVEGWRFNVMVNVWVHAVKRQALTDLEAYLRRSIRLTAGLSNTDLAALRNSIRSLCTIEGGSNHAPEENASPCPQLSSIYSSFRRLSLPREWRSFAAAAADYYLFTARSDRKKWAEVENYAFNSRTGERFINETL
jgi:hypothetical protein